MTLINSQSVPYRKAFSANATRSSFSVPNATATKPVSVATATAERSIIVEDKEGTKFNNLVIQPLLTDAANETGSIQVYGWEFSGNPAYWYPRLICELSVTAGAATTPEADEFIADTISITSGSTDVVKVSSGADDTPAYAVIDTLGAELIEIQTETGTAASMNVLYKRV